MKKYTYLENVIGDWWRVIGEGWKVKGWFGEGWLVKEGERGEGWKRGEGKKKETGEKLKDAEEVMEEEMEEIAMFQDHPEVKEEFEDEEEEIVFCKTIK